VEKKPPLPKKTFAAKNKAKFMKKALNVGVSVAAGPPKDAEPLQSLKDESRKCKQQVLMRACMPDPVGWLIQPIRSKTAEQTTEDHCCHISLCFANLAWASEGKKLREGNQIGFIPAMLSHTFLTIHAIEDQTRVQKLCMKRCKQLADRMLEIKCLILVPVRVPAPGQHFTLLALSKTEGSLSSTESRWTIRYHDSLGIANKLNFDAAVMLLSKFWCLGDLLPERKNVTGQKSVDSAFHVMHYMEAEMRFFSGQGQGTQGQPDKSRIKAIRETMVQVTHTLENERRTWEMTLLPDVHCATKPIADNFAKAQQNQDAFSIANLASTREAKESFTGGASLLRVSVPDDFAVPEADAKGKEKAGAEDANDGTAVSAADDSAKVEAKPKAKAKQEAAAEFAKDGPAEQEEVPTDQANEPGEVSDSVCHHRRCPSCTGPFSSWKKGGKCKFCLMKVPRSTVAFQCFPCGGELYCSGCAEGLALQQPAPGPQLEEGPRDEELPDSVRAENAIMKDISGPCVEVLAEASAVQPKEETPAEQENKLRVKLAPWKRSIPSNVIDDEWERNLGLFNSLNDDRKNAIENVTIFGIGLCYKCQWVSGCRKCDPVKALKFNLSEAKLISA
jgi:hypothetical protein